MSLNTLTLNNGLRVIHMQSYAHVVYSGIIVNAGTRNETPAQSGMAHFMEHMSFKGTGRRSAWHILNRMEAVGGDLNAFTTKEDTVFYCASLERDFERSAELLGDIVFNSTYPQSEIEKEVGVIVDEIRSYQDSPSELIFDDFEALLFKGSPLAAPILGTEEQLLTYRTEHARAFADTFYNPSNTVFFVYGNLDRKRVERVAARFLEKYVNHSVEYPVLSGPGEYTAQCVEMHKDTHQAHVMIGNRGVGGRHENRIGLYLLNNVLGGPGMNSRLNLSMRERTGLVYNVESNVSSYTDTGVFCIYFGCDLKDIDRCRRIAVKELEKLCQDGLSEAQLHAAKKQLIGQMGVSTDSFENVALGLGKSWLHYGDYQVLSQLTEQINGLDRGKLLDIAQDIFNTEELTTLIYK